MLASLRRSSMLSGPPSALACRPAKLAAPLALLAKQCVAICGTPSMYPRYTSVRSSLAPFASSKWADRLHGWCVKNVQRLGIDLAQIRYNLPELHSRIGVWSNPGRFVNIKTSALYPETAINTQPIFKKLPLLTAYLYTLYTGPTNTNNLNKRITS